MNSLFESPAGARNTCAVRDAATGDLYVGTDRGVLVYAPATGALTHVKLKGERMQACARGIGEVWFAGAEHLVRFDTASKATAKLRRADFGLGRGHVSSLLVEGDALWIGLHAEKDQPALARFDPATKRVLTFAKQAHGLGGHVRGLAATGPGVCVLGGGAILWFDRAGELQDELALNAHREESDAMRWSGRGDSAALTTLRQLMDFGSLSLVGTELIGRDHRELWSFKLPKGPVRVPWPRVLACLGSVAVEGPRGGTLVATPFGLVHWDGEHAQQLTSEAVLAILPGERTVVVTPGGATELTSAETVATPVEPPFSPELARGLLPAAARHALEFGPPKARAEALGVLAAQGEPAEKALVLAALSDPSRIVRLRACLEVERHKVSAASDKLKELADGSDNELKPRAVLALVALGDLSRLHRLTDCVYELPVEQAREMLRDLTRGDSPVGIEVLRPFVLDGRPLVRRTALLHLGRLGYPQPMLGAIAMLERPDVGERVRGAELLARQTDPLALYLVTAHLADPSAEVRRAARLALVELIDRQPCPEDLKSSIVRAIEPVLARGPDDAPAFEAAVALAGLVDHALPPDLISRCLEGGPVALRRAAIRAAEHRRLRDQLPAIAASLKDVDPGVRADAVRALGQLGDPRALRPLFDLLQDPVVFLTDTGQGPGYRSVSQAMARIAGLDFPAERQASYDRWAQWYRERLLPVLERLGVTAPRSA